MFRINYGYCFPAIPLVARRPIIIVVVQTTEPGIFAGEFDFPKTLKEKLSPAAARRVV